MDVVGLPTQERNAVWPSIAIGHSSTHAARGLPPCLVGCLRHQVKHTRSSIQPEDINNQVGRRNLSATDRVKLLQRKKGILEMQAKARQNAALGTSPKRSGMVAEIFTQPLGTPGRVAEQLAAEAGISRPTYNALAKVVEHGTPVLALREPWNHDGFRASILKEQLKYHTLCMSSNHIVITQ